MKYEKCHQKQLTNATKDKRLSSGDKGCTLIDLQAGHTSCVMGGYDRLSVDLNNSALAVNGPFEANCVRGLTDEGVNRDINDGTRGHFIKTIQEDSDKNMRDLPISLTQGPLAKLWGSKSTPLLQPVHSKNTAKILSKLDLQMDKQKLEAISSPEIKSGDRENITCPFRVWYDVYLPQASFRKSSPRLPNYRVTVCKPSDPLPTYEDVKMLTGSNNDSVPLLFAICTISSVTFYCFSKTQLSTMISKG